MPSVSCGPFEVSASTGSFVLSERHLGSVLKTYINNYNRERPHRGLDLRIPEGGPPVGLADATGSVVRRDRIGGLIHEYQRKAA
jgi:putative transposase